MTATTSALRSEASLVMTRATINLFDESILDKTTLLNLELKRQERRRNLRYRNSVLLDEVPKQSKAAQVLSNAKNNTLERKSKTPDEYAKDLEQWLKKMKCTGVTGLRLESFADIKVGVLDEKLDINAPSVEPFPDLWSQKFKYKGYKDEHGRAKGKAVIEFDNGDSITGSFLEGKRHGECRIELVNENDFGISYIIGNYVKDQLNGKIKIGYTNEDYMEGFCTNGHVEGFVRKHNAKKKLIYFGTYSKGRPCGINWHLVPDGGVIVGYVDDVGDLSGSEIAFLYPDMKTALYGTFCKGQLVEAQATTLECVIEDPETKLLIPLFNDPEGPIYRRDISDFEAVTKDPLLPDPYENAFVEVKPSKVEGANEGLFCKRDVPPNTILAFYNGIRREPKNPNDPPKDVDWVASGYRIQDPTRKKGSLDIPNEYRLLQNYCASLAHKTNHSFLPSAEFEDFVHPRFGLIPCVMSSENIKKGEEIFIHYGYTLNHCPDWYEAAWAKQNYPVPDSFEEWHEAVKKSLTESSTVPSTASSS